MSIQEEISVVIEYHKKAKAYCDSQNGRCHDCIFFQERGYAGAIDGCGPYGNPSEKEFEAVMAFEGSNAVNKDDVSDVSDVSGWDYFKIAGNLCENPL